MKYGIEIEFCIKDDELLLLLNDFKETYKNSFVFSLEHTTSSLDKIIIKTEPTVKGGLEINIPPNFTNDLENICSLINKYNVYYTNNCALHIHIDATNINLNRLINYYSNNEQDILNYAIEQELTDKYHIALNRSINEDRIQNCKFIHMNIYHAFINHRTVEHRIYKATTDYNKIKQCIDQTINIIKQAGE